MRRARLSDRRVRGVGSAPMPPNRRRSWGQSVPGRALAADLRGRSVAVPAVRRRLALLGVSQCYVALNDFANGEGTARQALELETQLSGARTTAVIRARNTLARALVNLERYDEAEAFIRTDIEYIGKLHGKTHPNYAGMLVSLAEVLQAKGESREAEGLLRRAIGLLATTPNAPRRQIQAIAALGRLLLDTGRPAEAEPLLRRALTIREEFFAPSHRAIAESRSDLGAALAALGRSAEAEPLLVRSHEDLRNSLGADKPETIRARKHLEEFRALKLETPQEAFLAVLQAD